MAPHADTLQFLSQLWQYDGSMVPLPTPSSLMREDLEGLKGYLVSEKTDGVRGILVVGIRLDDKNTPFVARVSRNGKVEDYGSLISFKDGDEVEMGSVLDGEWIHSSKCPRAFMVFDCIAAFGASVKEAPLTHRLMWADYVVRRLRSQIPIRVKTFHPPGPEATRLIRCVCEGRMSGVDGLVFSPTQEGMGVGRLHRYYKYKPLHMITIDLHWDAQHQVLLCENEEGEDMFIDEAIPASYHAKDFKTRSARIVRSYAAAPV
jgi:hypothetical protein